MNKNYKKLNRGNFLSKLPSRVTTPCEMSGTAASAMSWAPACVNVDAMFQLGVACGGDVLRGVYEAAGCDMAGVVRRAAGGTHAAKGGRGAGDIEYILSPQQRAVLRGWVFTRLYMRCGCGR